MSIQLRRMVDISVVDAKKANLFIYSDINEQRGLTLLREVGESVAERWCVRQATQDDAMVAHQAIKNFASVSLESIAANLVSWINGCQVEYPTIAIDVSCMSRPTMAAVFQGVFDSAQKKQITVQVLYVIAEYAPPPQTPLPPNEDICPISDWFAGWPSDATASTSLVVGLGYEKDKAIGACEYFDAGDTWVLTPRSPINAYDREVESNNEDLLKRAKRRDRMAGYLVERPTETFGLLVAIVSSILPKMNPVLLPFGPKILFALSLIVAAVYREVGVWHVTGDTELIVSEQAPSAYRPAFEVQLAPFNLSDAAE